MNEKDKDVIMALQKEKLQKQQKLINALEQEVYVLRRELKRFKRGQK